MLGHLKLDNFKIWKSTGTLRLAPVTLLLGTNSSGKSSLIQALLLIRQTVQSKDENLDLNLGNPDDGDSVTLGQFRDVLCRHGDSDKVGIEFRWSQKGGDGHAAIFSAQYAGNVDGVPELVSLRIGLEAKEFAVERKASDTYTVRIPNVDELIIVDHTASPKQSFVFPRKFFHLVGEEPDVNNISFNLREELSRIIYLGPVRRLAQRDYMWNGRMPASISDDGAKAIDVLIADGVASAKARKEAAASGQPDPFEFNTSLFMEVEHWLQRMGLADAITVEVIGHSARYELLIHRDGEVSNLKDVGVGVAQVLPVIVAALFAKPGHIVILEEPESHLHPLAQAVLAELFAAVSRERGVQFIVETHSEHLFRRMQTLMAKGEISQQQLAMYFVSRQGKEAKIDELQADEVGRIKNWPDKFFGDVLGETREQTRLAFEQQKKARSTP